MFEMQDKNTEFDLKIRFMLQNAEEDVPPQVWSAVSSRLGAGSKRGAVWIKRSSLFVAAAAVAAVVAVVTLPGIKDNSNYSDTSSLAMAEIVRPESQESNIPSTNLTQVESSASNGALDFAQGESQGSAKGINEKAKVQEIAGENAEGIETITETPLATIMGGGEISTNYDVDAEGDETQCIVKGEESVKESDGNEVKVPVAKEIDPFARLEWEDSKKIRSRNRTASLVAGGNVATNGNAASSYRSSMMMAKGSTTTTSVTQVSKDASYSIPLSFGVGARLWLTDRFSVGLGVDYSLLRTSFTGQYTEVSGGTTVKSISSDVHSSVHYIGVPLDFYFDVVKAGKASVYVYAGGEVEKGLVNRYRITDSPSDIIYHESVDGLQWSLEAGFGVVFMLNDWMGIYIDPGVKYYFDCDQPLSIRTQQQFTFGIDFGLRFDL